MKLGASTLTFRRLPLAAAVARIRQLGFDTVDLCCLFPSYCPHYDPTASTNINVTIIEDTLAGLRVATLNAAMAPWNSTDRIVRSAQLEFVAGSLRAAKTLGAQVVTVQSGNKPRIESDWLGSAQIVSEAIRLAAHQAGSFGVKLGIEIRAGMLVETVEQAAKLLELVASPAVGVTVDTGSLAATGVDVAAAIEQLGARIQHVHLRDGKPGSPMLTPGDGAVDFAAVARALRKIGYDRVCSLALDWPKPPNDPTEELRRARVHVADAFEAAA
ncbi:MAG: sugar phosphate isomerase/epimerase [Verrucomicrobia bacterium]|nr:sugar phosphate isomerase/epimerase [Verrucomicrobiota bacterium]